MANEFVIKNGYFSQGNSNVTGSLSVTQNVTASKALFSSSGVNQLMVLGSGSSSWLTGIYGSQGNLLTVIDTFSGSLFTVTDISGYTILDIASDYYTSSIQMIGTASLTGSLSITENLTVGQNLTASKALISSSGNEQLMVMGSGSSSWITGIYGSQGNLLTITDNMSGSIFTVTDISGYPILDVVSGTTNNLIVSGGFLVYDTINNFTNIDSSQRYLYDTDGQVAVDWAFGNLNFGGSTTLGWENRILYSGGGNSVLDWGSQLLYDNTNILSADWNSRVLIANDGNIAHIDWGNPLYMNFPSTTESPITRVLGMDSSNNVYWTSSTAIGGGGGGPSTTINNNVDNYIITATGTANTLNGEANLSFDGSLLSVTGSVRATSITGSLTGSLIGSLTGTASWAQSASQALTASFWSGYRSTSSLIGGSGTSYNIDHNFGTRNVHVTVYSSSGTYETVYPDIQRPTINRVTVLFNNVPATDEFTVYISQ